MTDLLTSILSHSGMEPVISKITGNGLQIETHFLVLD